MNVALLKFIASYSKKFSETNLQDSDPPQIQANSWHAFDFFLWHACYQGRSDRMSAKVYAASREVLLAHFVNAMDGTTQEGALRQELAGRIGKGEGKVGKGRDIEMILSALGFVQRLPAQNIACYSLDRIRRGQLREHYLELQAAESNTGITQVGPKVAAFYLRDLVSLFNLSDQIGVDAAYCLQPIDTWVRKLTGRIGIANPGADDLSLQKGIAIACLQNGISPVEFNQGAWYVGFNSLDVLLGLPDDAYEKATPVP